MRPVTEGSGQRLSGRAAGTRVYSIREPAERAEAARELARGRPALFYLGLYTAVRTLRPDAFDRGGSEYFWRVKPERPLWSKLPLILRPRDALRLADFSRVHPAFAHLAARERWEALWASHGAPLHVIAPLREPLRLLNRAFQTFPGDLAAQEAANPVAADRRLPCTTASFFWMEDDDWHDFALRVAVHSPPASYLGGTSFNAHGEDPPYTLAELDRYLAGRDELPFEFVISDPWFESAGIHSSHTMVRLPLEGEAPEFVMTRRGSVSPEMLEGATGMAVRELESVASASTQPGLSRDELDRRVRTFSSQRSAARMQR